MKLLSFPTFPQGLVRVRHLLDAWVLKVMVVGTNYYIMCLSGINLSPFDSLDQMEIRSSVNLDEKNYILIFSNL